MDLLGKEVCIPSCLAISASRSCALSGLFGKVLQETMGYAALRQAWSPLLGETGDCVLPCFSVSPGLCGTREAPG
jgi:hypothetical protein